MISSDNHFLFIGLNLLFVLVFLSYQEKKVIFKILNWSLFFNKTKNSFLNEKNK